MERDLSDHNKSKLVCPLCDSIRSVPIVSRKIMVLFPSLSSGLSISYGYSVQRCKRFSSLSSN